MRSKCRIRWRQPGQLKARQNRNGEYLRETSKNMEYQGKIYGKIGNRYFDTGRTTEEWDEMKKALQLARGALVAIRDEADAKVLPDAAIIRELAKNGLK